MNNEANVILPVYTSDVSGVNSALYELDGMTIMHDASGCNSTYNTHDEPRWYTIASRIYLSGLDEYGAILGDEDKLIHDAVTTAQEQNPRFIALAPSPISMMMGQDIKAIGRLIEKQTDIPTFGIETNGLHSYLAGVSKAFISWAQRFIVPVQDTVAYGINIIGATPLDFARQEVVDDIINSLQAQGLNVLSTWAMGTTPEAMAHSGRAQCNLVISSDGRETAEYLKKRFGTPFLMGLPFGEKATSLLTHFIKELIEGKDEDTVQKAYEKALSDESKAHEEAYEGQKAVVIGEAVYAHAVAALLPLDTQVFTLLTDCQDTRDKNLHFINGEEDLQNKIQDFDYVIGDPFFHSITSKRSHFIPLPHYAYSGRQFAKAIPSLAGAKGEVWILSVLRENQEKNK